MQTLKHLINTIGLDASFFYQFILVCVLYFISRSLFKAYLNNFIKREELTKGRLLSGQKIKEQIIKQKLVYENKTKDIQKSFQNIFNKIKKQSLDQYKKDKTDIEKSQQEILKTKRKELQQGLKEQDAQVEAASSSLTQLLVKKIKT